MSRPPDAGNTRPIPFIDLQAQRARIAGNIDAAIRRVLDHGNFIMGPEVGELEARLAGYCGAGHAITCASGTDALLLALMARGVGRGDAVFTPAFSFPAAAEAAALLGAVPVFVDVSPQTFNIDPESLAAAISEVAREGRLRPAAVVPVDMFGHPAPYAAVRRAVEGSGAFVLADAAQSFGAALGGARVGTLGDATATSFYPAKPLGCYGDGGCVFTDDDELATTIRTLRIHGQGRDRHDLVRIGVNGRLDTLQAAILIEKLAIFDDELEARRRIAERYAAGLRDIADLALPGEGARSAWAYFTVALDDRDAVAARLEAQGIPTAVYYPEPLHRQPAYAGFPVAPGGAPGCEVLARRVLSLPLHPYLDAATQDRIVEAVRAAVSAGPGDPA